MLKTQQEIRREARTALVRADQLIAEVAAQNLLSMIAADEMARFLMQPMDTSRFGEARDERR